MPQRFRGISRLDGALLSVCVCALGATVIYPTARLFISAFEAGSLAAVTSGSGVRAIINTLLISLGTVVTSGVFGTTLAVLLHRYRFPGRTLLSAVAFLPFALPPLVGVLSFWYLIGPDGLIPRSLERWFELDNAHLDGPAGILIIHTYSFYVLFYAMVLAALDGMDPSLTEAARSHGASPWRAFTRVTLPLLRPALVGAALLTFMSSGASFSAPFFFGADFPVLSTQIYLERSQSRVAEEVSLTVALAMLGLLGVLLFRAQRGVTGGSKGLRSVAVRGARQYLAGALAALVVFVLLVPHLTIAWLSFIDHRAWHTELIPLNVTLENYRVLIADGTMFRPILNSLWMSAVAAVATLVVGLPCGYLIGRRRPGGTLTNFLVMVPWALPGTVVAINLLLAFNRPWAPAELIVALLPMAYFVRSIPMFARMATAAIQVFDGTLIEAGRSLGASPRYCLVHIVLPVLAPAIVSTAALVFATCLGEFVASILLYSQGNMPIAVKINEQWRGIGLGSAFAYSVFLMTLVTVTFLVSRRFSSRMI